ncbi:MAG TPA: hypothetical protein DCX22_02315 [Dehalococcoidia bacterium]|nr:hypothetical protein [Dehalococcoidia bacterium]
MKDIFTLKKDFMPRACDMIASWPGISNVSLLVAGYLKDKLKAEEVGKLEPYNFFDPTGVMVKENVVEAPQFPENKLFYWHNPKAERDILLFIGDEQPAAKGYDLAQRLLDISIKLKVKRVFTCAAAIAKIHHTEKPHVWAAATRKDLVDYVKQYNVILRGAVQIAGLNGLFLGVAKERNVDGFCLLGEVPAYATRIANPKAALAILEVLTKMLTIEVDLADLVKLSADTEEEMKKLASEAMGEFISRYTRPVWPQAEEEDEDMEEEDMEDIDDLEDDEDEDEDENKEKK